MSKDDDEILGEAKSRFKHCSDFESRTRENMRYDRRFDSQDCFNMYGWPADLYGPRISEAKPCLTVNKVHQHVLQVANDSKMNQPGITIRPVGNGATFKAAEILEGVIRHIEYQSNATDAYQSAVVDMVTMGIGWWRIVTDYSGDDTFSQDIFIKRIPDGLSVFMDPAIKEVDGSDAQYAFLYTEMPKDQFDIAYPKFKDQISASPLGVEGQDDYDWLTLNNNKSVRLVEYYRKVAKKDTLHLLADGSTMRESDAKDAGILSDLRDQSQQSRDITTHEVEWYLIGGDKVLDQAIFPGQLIPLVRIIGEERVIDGILSRNGLVRSLIDSQRMYNVMNSAAVEAVGVQTKVPWLISASALENNTQMWDNANTKNYPYLVWNDFDDAGQRSIPEPHRTDPPQYPPAYGQGLTQAAADMNAASGQQEANFGVETNERSGKAIGERERAGNRATYHFVDHLAIGIRYTGKVILGIIPSIYDVQRVLKVNGEDGSQTSVGIDPTQSQAHRPVNSVDPESFSQDDATQVLNPNVGIYDVQSTVGPNFGTRRQEAFNAISQILMQNASLASVCGDLLFKSADFPLADEIAERLRNMVPPQALGQGPDPAVAQAQQMLAQQHSVMMQQGQEILELKNKALIAQQQKDIDEFRAQTERLKAVGGIDKEALMPVIREMVSQLLGQPVNPLVQAHALEQAVTQNIVQQMAPPPDQTMQQGPMNQQ